MSQPRNTNARINLTDLTGGNGEQATVEAAPPPGSPTELVPVRGGHGTLLRVARPPVLVLGSSGSAGTTSTALGLAAVLAAGDDDHREPIAVDATPTGGDLARRGCDLTDPGGTVQNWLTAQHRYLPSVVAATAGASAAGFAIMTRGPEHLPRRESYTSVHADLTQAGYLPIYDGGGAVNSATIAPLLTDPRIALAITVAARADAVNRLTPALSWLDDHYTEFHIAEAVIVVTRQTETDNAIAANHIRTYLSDWVRAVVEIPHDKHLATGGRIATDRLATTTRAAYQHLLDQLR